MWESVVHGHIVLKQKSQDSKLSVTREGEHSNACAAHRRARQRGESLEKTRSCQVPFTKGFAADPRLPGTDVASGIEAQ